MREKVRESGSNAYQTRNLTKTVYKN